MRYLLGISLSLLLLITQAKTEDIYPITDPQQRAVFEKLSNNLRCMVCQNQTLADSNAELAVAMRRKIYQMVLAGQNAEAIETYLQQRYGDFILFSPPLNWRTSTLWLLPFILMFVGAVGFILRAVLQRDEGT